MSTSADRRILGLSPRARRVVIPGFVIAIAVIAIGTYTNRRTDTADENGPVVGTDVHAVAELDDRVFVGGHGGAGYRTGSGWTQIPTLGNKDVMAWAESRTTLLAAGHAGLYSSLDAGQTFTTVGDVANADIHALGASDKAIYLATTDLGVMVSTDGGRVFDLRSDAGRAFMGSIWVQAGNPDVAIAASMTQGVVKTTDGGETWTALGSAKGLLSVAVNASGRDIAAVSMNGAQLSVNGGKSWAKLAVPDGTGAASYTAKGDLLVASLRGDRASVFQHTTHGWSPLT